MTKDCNKFAPLHIQIDAVHCPADLLDLSFFISSDIFMHQLCCLNDSHANAPS